MARQITIFGACKRKIFLNSLRSLRKIKLIVEPNQWFKKIINPLHSRHKKRDNPGWGCPFFLWRSGGDSNPRYSFSTIYRFSKPTPSASRPPLHNLVSSFRLKTISFLLLALLFLPCGFEDKARLGEVRR